MKTMEELQNLTIPVLKGIITDLGATPGYKTTKDNLVQLAYDLQQPDTPETNDADVKAEETSFNDRNFIGEDHIENMEFAIAEYFEGELVDLEEENEDGAALFEVQDMVGDAIVKGTLSELFKLTLVPPAASLSVEEEPTPMIIEDKTLPEAKTNDVKAVDKALAALSRTGLKYEINGGCVRMSFGSKLVTTTVNQPLYRIVRTAQTLCNL